MYVRACVVPRRIVAAPHPRSSDTGYGGQQPRAAAGPAPAFSHGTRRTPAATHRCSVAAATLSPDTTTAAPQHNGDLVRAHAATCPPHACLPRTWLRKLSSPMHFPWWSSQIMTCACPHTHTEFNARHGLIPAPAHAWDGMPPSPHPAHHHRIPCQVVRVGRGCKCHPGVQRMAFHPTRVLSGGRLWWCGGGVLAFVGGYFGAGPPPTIARMLQRKSISTIPMPPLLKPRQNCSQGGRHPSQGSEQANISTRSCQPLPSAQGGWPPGGPAPGKACRGRLRRGVHGCHPPSP